MRAIEEPWQEYGGALRVDGATRSRSIRVLLAIARPSVLTAVLAGFGRTISEVGAVLIVGGNIADYTRIMTTAIEGFSHFVTSMPAPIASGGSESPGGLHPLESAALSRRTPIAVLDRRARTGRT